MQSSHPAAGRSTLAVVRKLTVRGLLTLLPLAFTLWVLSLLLGFLNARVAPLVGGLLAFVGVEDWRASDWWFLVPMAGLLLFAGLLMLVGLLATNLFGKRLLSRLEKLLLSVPVVRPIYGSAKQLLEAITVGGKGAFQEVVALEYPRRGVWALGFITSRIPSSTSLPGWEGEMVSVFLPTTPNPTSGFLLILPLRDVHRMPFTVEEGIKLIVSGGLVLPPPARDGVAAVPAAQDG